MKYFTIVTSLCVRCNVFIFARLSKYAERVTRGFNRQFTALFNNMRTLKLKAQPTTAFFAAVNQMFSGSSQLRLRPTRDNHIVEHSS